MAICAGLLWTAVGTADDDPARVARAQKLPAVGEVKSAQESLATLSPRDPLQEKEVLALCDLLESQGRSEEEIELLEQQWAFHSSSTQLGETLAELFIRLNQSEKAIPVYRKLLSLRPDEGRYWKRLGTLFLWNENQEEAILAYEQAVRCDSADAEALGQLAQLYEWNEHQREAFEIQKRLLKLQPNNLELWKKHGIQARWQGENREAIVAFKNILMRDPRNTEAFFLLGETFLWEGQTHNAEICFRQVLRKQPQNAQAHFYYAQTKHWQPFGWWEARHHYREALHLESGHRDAHRYLDLIRKDFGPQSTVNYYLIHDSNDLKKTTVTASHGQYLSPRLHLEGEFYSIRLFERKPGGDYLADGRGTDLLALWHASRQTRFALQPGIVNYQGIGPAFTLSVEWQQTLSDRRNGIGQLYSTLGARTEPVLDGVLAVRAETKARRIYQSFYWQPSPAFHLGSDFRYGWYSDRNEKLQFTTLGEYHFYSRNPAFSAEGLFAYEDTKLVFPNAVPYWTPDRYWTRSLGLLSRYRWRGHWHFMAGIAVTQQPGNELATNRKLQVEFTPNDFAYFQLLFQEYGSRYYSYNNVQARLSYRW